MLIGLQINKKYLICSGRNRNEEEVYLVLNKKWVSPLYRTAQPNTLALFPTWGSQWELVVKDLPTAKLTKF